jgi:hypothetical protein
MPHCHNNRHANEMHEQRDVVVIGVDGLSILVHAFDVAVRQAQAQVAVRSGGDVLRAVAMSSAAARSQL